MRTTCGGPHYGRAARGGTGYGTDRGPGGKYEDLIAFMERPGELAAIVPKDPAERTGRLIRQEPGSYTFETRHWGLSNHNSAFRRSLWLEFPFDEALPATEDKAWGAEAMARGYSIIYDPAAAVQHRRRPVLHEFRRSSAIQAGYKALFPELRPSFRAEVTSLQRRTRNRLLRHARARDVVQLFGDARRLPSTVAGLLGRLRSRL